MSSQSQPGPTAIHPQGGGVPLAPTPDQLQQSFDYGIWYALSLWPALHVAVQNAWGGPDTADKKDWFAGAVSDLFTSRPDTDAEDLEIFLLQIMQDEFDCNVEDESECEVARTILRLKKSLAEDRSLEGFRELEHRWRNRGQMKVDVKVVETNQEVDDDDEEAWNEAGDVDMGVREDGVPNLVPVQPRREREAPEIDEDGFEKVKRKR
ncbi:pre-rrna-processing protein tsr2 [Teratosphaeria destructans]|uniref:Pre-rrna-processing protein tsr2 n=1 Tax=Teratosphaeria destructans TaxID=418781 RepID=A0A9W7SVN2_9PEZI|nr:pre-rrna-processing protein tsr2 [Teratosphaeria destructans]